MSELTGRDRALVRVREVEPDDSWGAVVGSGVGGGPHHVLPKLVESEQRLPFAERAAVLYFDLSRFTSAGNSIDAVLKWAGHYRQWRGVEEVAARLAVVGRQVRGRDQRRLAAAEIHFLNEGRASIRRLLGSGPRNQQIYRLIQSLCGNPVAASSFPGAGGGAAGAFVGVVPPPSTSPSGAGAADWDASYTSRPAHIKPDEVEALFGLLSQKLEDWERDD